MTRIKWLTLHDGSEAVSAPMVLPENELAPRLQQLVHRLHHNFGVRHGTQHTSAQNGIDAPGGNVMSLKNVGVFNTADDKLINMLKLLLPNLSLQVGDKVGVALNANDSRHLGLVEEEKLVAHARTQLEDDALARWDKPREWRHVALVAKGVVIWTLETIIANSRARNQLNVLYHQ